MRNFVENIYCSYRFGKKLQLDQHLRPKPSKGCTLTPPRVVYLAYLYCFFERIPSVSMYFITSKNNRSIK